MRLHETFWQYGWYQSLRSTLRANRSTHQIRQWETGGRVGPPPHAIKQQVLRNYAKDFGLKILVESGTYHGDMIDGLKDLFDIIYSIELSKELYEKACWRFRSAPHIRLIHGDSGTELQKVVRNLEGPALFWLDGHYSAGPTARGELSTPIVNEVRHVLSANEKRHVMVIDDAHCFGTEHDYPTIAELSEIIRCLRPDAQIAVECDSIRVLH
jgi:hypothetical protein